MIECVKCGYCCEKGPCSYGQWDGAKCVFLTEEKLCSRYDEISRKEKGTKYPMFECGCSSSLFNTVRDEKVKQMLEKKNETNG